MSRQAMVGWRIALSNQVRARRVGANSRNLTAIRATGVTPGGYEARMTVDIIVFIVGHCGGIDGVGVVQRGIDAGGVIVNKAASAVNVAAVIPDDDIARYAIGRA